MPSLSFNSNETSLFLQSLNNTLYCGNQFALHIVATPIFHEHEKHIEFISYIPQLPPNLQMFLQSCFTCIDFQFLHLPSSGQYYRNQLQYKRKTPSLSRYYFRIVSSFSHLYFIFFVFYFLFISFILFLIYFYSYLLYHVSIPIQYVYINKNHQ